MTTASPPAAVSIAPGVMGWSRARRTRDRGRRVAITDPRTD